MDQTCPSCGADNLASARYCRKCGIQMGSSQFHEAPTRNFGPGAQGAPDHMSSAPRGSAYNEQPRYVPPGVAQNPSGYQMQPANTGIPHQAHTSPMTTGQIGKKGASWPLVIGGIVLTVILAIGMLVVLIVSTMRHKPEAPVATEKADRDDDEDSNDFPFEGSIDPSKLPPLLKPWYYPGAKITVPFAGSLGPFSAGTLIMQSDDDVATVASYYREKFGKMEGRTETIKDETVIFSSSEGASVVIQQSDEDDDVTQIIASAGDTTGGEHAPGTPVPAPPVVPPPPPPPTVVTPEAPSSKDSKAPEAKPEKGKAAAAEAPAAPKKP